MANQLTKDEKKIAFEGVINDYDLPNNIFWDTIVASRYDRDTQHLMADFLLDNILTEERIQREYDCGRDDGAKNERARIGKLVETMAASAFVDMRDEDAQSLRKLAKTIKEMK